MKKAQTWIMILCLGLLGGFLYRTAQADEWNKETKITFSDPVEIPGKVLPAGTYTFKLMDSQSNRNIVQIYNEDRTKLFATVLAVPNYRLRPTGKTVIGFQERPAGQAEALEAWFYPGDNYGQEFVYPHNRATELAKLNKVNVYSMPESSTELNQAQVTTIQPSGEEQQMTETTQNNAAQSTTDTNAQSNAEVAPAPAETAPAPAEAAPAPAVTTPAPSSNEAERQAPDTSAPAAEAPAQTSAPMTERAPRHMPKTASSIWLYLLAGLGSMTSGLILYRTANQRG